MYYVVPTEKSFAQAVGDLDAAVKRHHFGVLHVHDLGATLRSKGQSFAGESKVFEVCSPRHAADVLGLDPKMNMALPCRISVYTEGSQTRIGMISPRDMLAFLSEDAELVAVAREVDAAIRHMINEAAGTEAIPGVLADEAA